MKMTKREITAKKKEVQESIEIISAIITLKGEQGDFMSMVELRTIVSKIKDAERFALSTLTEHGKNVLFEKLGLS